MSSVYFVCPNKRTLPRSQRIADKTWELYRADIIREFRSGRGKGYAQALRWIKDKKIAGFDPSTKQLSHRIKEVWRADVHTQIALKANLGSRCRTPDRSLFKTLAEEPVELEELIHLRNGQSQVDMKKESIATKTDTCTRKDEEEEIVVSFDNQRMLQTKDDGEEDIGTKSILLKTKREECKASLMFEDLHAHQTPPSKHSAAELLYLPRATIAADYITPVAKPSDKVKLQRQWEADDDTIEKPSKRLKIEPTNLFEGFGDTLRRATSPRSFLRTDHEPKFDGIARACAMQTAFKIGQAHSSICNSINELASNASSQEVVLDPERLRKILSRIGIDWDLATVSQYLRKDYIFRAFGLPCDAVPLIEKLGAEVRQVLAFAEFLFATSVLEDAFPLFLLVWSLLCHESGNQRAIVLVRCARAAKQREDRVLAQSLLRESLWMLETDWPKSVVTRALFSLELSQLYQAYDSKEDSNHLYCEGIDIILPECASLIGTFNKAHKEFQDDAASSRHNNKSYNISQNIVIQAFDLTFPKNKGMGLQSEDVLMAPLHNCYTLRDVLLANILLGNDHDRSVAISGIRHLRSCLKHAEGILRRPWCEDSYCNFQVGIDSNWPGITSKVGRAIFFDLITNWSPFQYCEYLDIEHDNTFIGLSTLEIISTTSFIVCSKVDTHDAIDVRHRGCVGSRVADLIALSDEALLFSFLWFSVQQNRIRSYEDLQQADCPEIWVDWVTEIYKTIKKGKWEEQVMFEPSLTLAESIITSSTLSAMRKHSRTTRFSKNCESNLRSYSTPYPVQQWIDLTADNTSMHAISDLMNKFTVGGDSISVNENGLHSELLDTTLRCQNSELRETVDISQPPDLVATVEVYTNARVFDWYPYALSSDHEEQPRDGG